MRNKLIFFFLGFFGYGRIEVLWRGHTHRTMAIAGVGKEKGCPSRSRVV